MDLIYLNWNSIYLGIKVPNPINAKTTKMEEKKFHINNLLVRRRSRAALKLVLAADSCFVKVFISADS